MSVIDTGGLPYELNLVIGKSYIITTNIDVSDGLANSAIGKLEYVEMIDDNDLDIEFCENVKNSNYKVKRPSMKFTDTKIGQ